MRAAIYSRVSTATKSRRSDPSAHDQKPEVQEEILRRVAAQRGWHAKAAYSDRASGSQGSPTGPGRGFEGRMKRDADNSRPESAAQLNGLIEAAVAISRKRNQALCRLRTALKNDNMDELKSAARELCGIDHEQESDRADSRVH